MSNTNTPTAPSISEINENVRILVDDSTSEVGYPDCTDSDQRSYLEGGSEVKARVLLNLDVLEGDEWDIANIHEELDEFLFNGGDQPNHHDVEWLRYMGEDRDYCEVYKKDIKVRKVGNAHLLVQVHLITSWVD